MIKIRLLINYIAKYCVELVLDTTKLTLHLKLEWTVTTCEDPFLLLF
jgi:hypothetical protein